MKLTRLVPLLRVPDLDDTIRFYTGLLEFQCANRMEGWACLQKDDIELMVALPNGHDPFEQSQFTGSFYFTTDEVDDLWERIRDHAAVVYPLETFDYGMREFAIRDNNGYLLQFGKSVE